MKVDDGIFEFADIKHCPVLKLEANKMDIRFKSDSDLKLDDYLFDMRASLTGEHSKVYKMEKAGHYSDNYEDEL